MEPQEPSTSEPQPAEQTPPAPDHARPADPRFVPAPAAADQHRVAPAAAPRTPDRQRLFDIYQDLKSKYRNYDTRHALKRMQAFRRAVQSLTQKGFPVSIEILGSINFGLVEPFSDADCIILHYCDMHAADGECAPHCPNLLFEKDELLRSLNQGLGSDTCNIEVLDCINLTYIKRVIEENRFLNDPIILRFMFYRLMGRPVNRPLFIHYFEQLEQNADLLDSFRSYASEALTAYLKTSDHRHSFSKYNARILSKGLDLPPELEAELKEYLES